MQQESSREHVERLAQGVDGLGPTYRSVLHLGEIEAVGCSCAGVSHVRVCVCVCVQLAAVYDAELALTRSLCVIERFTFIVFPARTVESTRVRFSASR